jgi:hypothetical protein
MGIGEKLEKEQILAAQLNAVRLISNQRNLTQGA